MDKKTMRDIVIDFLNTTLPVQARAKLEDMSNEDLLDEYYQEREYQMNAD